jgi:hypothetical protein
VLVFNPVEVPKTNLKKVGYFFLISFYFMAVLYQVFLGAKLPGVSHIFQFPCHRSEWCSAFFSDAIWRVHIFLSPPVAFCVSLANPRKSELMAFGNACSVAFYGPRVISHIIKQHTARRTGLSSYIIIKQAEQDVMLLCYTSVVIRLECMLRISHAIAIMYISGSFVLTMTSPNGRNMASAQQRPPKLCHKTQCSERNFYTWK